MRSFNSLQKITPTTYEKVISGEAPSLLETGSLNFIMPDHTIMTAMTRAWGREHPDSLFVQAVHKYYRMQADIYQKRLDKYKPQETGSSEETSFDLKLGLSQPSFIVLNSTKPLTHPNSHLLGGIRVVLSRHPEEKMPFQSEPIFDHYLRENAKGWAAEIGRLTAKSRHNRRLSVDLITLAGYFTLQSPEVENFYVHTSRSHAKLYSRMGLTPHYPTFIGDPLNCLIHFSRREIIAFAIGSSPVKSLFQNA